MHIISVVGARPQFVKLAPISRACNERTDIRHTIIHTGQHYDANMSNVFFDELKIPDPDTNLGVGSGSHAYQTGAMMVPLEQYFERLVPDWVLVYGDTNSTLAASLAAVKIHKSVAHIEAGLRSFNRCMPEEHNRVLTDHASDLLLCPSPTAMKNLRLEGLEERSHLVGDLMVDVTLLVQGDLSGEDRDFTTLTPDPEFVLATLHRAENTDDPDRLRSIISALQQLDIPVLLAAHPRLRARAAQAGLQLSAGAVTPISPLPYRKMIAAIDAAAAVITDSGGLQKEAYVLGTPCTTVRRETEWVETLVGEWNVLVPDPGDLTTHVVLRDVGRAAREQPYGEGAAAEKILKTLLQGVR